MSKVCRISRIVMTELFDTILAVVPVLWINTEIRMTSSLQS